LRRGRPAAVETAAASLQGTQTTAQPAQSSQNAKPAPAQGGRVMPRSFDAFEMSRKNIQYIHLASLLLIYGSYVVLRVRKERKMDFYFFWTEKNFFCCFEKKCYLCKNFSKSI